MGSPRRRSDPSRRERGSDPARGTARAADHPRRAFPYAPHCTMPTPWPHPRPVTMARPLAPDTVYHADGTVVGSADPYLLGPGYRAGKRHGAHWLTAPSNVPTSIVRDVPTPVTTIEPPVRVTEPIRAPAGQSWARVRNRWRSGKGNVARQCDVGEAPSSCSTTGRRYGKGALPNTWSLPYVCPFEVEK